MRYAGFWIRFCAFILDTLVFAPIGILIGVLDNFISVLSAWTLGSWVIGWLYFSLMESSGWQATLGKRLCGIHVTDMNGNRITFGHATGRYFAKILSWATLYIGYLMAAFTEKKQGLHDILAGTLVVYGRPDAQPLIVANYGDDPSTERVYTEHNPGSKVVIAGFDTSGHVIRLTFEMDNPKLISEGLLIGRDSSMCDLLVRDPSISRVHAKIFQEGAQLFIEDMSSTNGTILDGQKIRPSQPARLHATGSLMLGDIDLSIGKY